MDEVVEFVDERRDLDFLCSPTGSNFYKIGGQLKFLLIRSGDFFLNEFPGTCFYQAKETASKASAHHPCSQDSFHTSYFLGEKIQFSAADLKIMNGALNTTLSRTLITAFTTVITVVVLFLFGGDVIKSFSFAILLGLIVGTYSSIFTASALVLDTVKWVEGRSKAK